MLALLVGGMANGAIYGLVAVGAVLVFRATGIVNFAQGELLMAGAYTYLLVLSVLAAPAQIVPVVGVGLLLGLVLFAVTHILLRRASELEVVIGTLATSIIWLNLARLVFSDIPRGVPGWLTGEATIGLSGGAITVNAVVTLVVGLVMTAAIYCWFRFTDSGRAVRAVAENPDYAALSGIPVRRMLALSWAIGGLLAAGAGLLLAPSVGVYPTVGGDVLFKGFVAASLGGFESEIGAMLGGIILGVIEVIGVVVIGGDMKDVIAFGLLLAVLLLRPTGLLGAAQARRA